MIRQRDEGIGRVLAALEESGLAENTLVVFTSDNGGERFSDSYPLHGKKMDLLEGGIRVPYIVRWPAKLPAGETYDRLAIGMDWMATFLAAAGVSPHPDYPLDGIDLFGEPVERNLCWRMLYRNQRAIRSGTWKWLSIEGNEFLFDLARDERERLPETTGTERPVVILRLRGHSNLGATMTEVLSVYADKLLKVNGRLYLTGLSGEAFKQVIRTGKFHPSAPVRIFEATSVRGESTDKAHADAAEWLVSDHESASR